MPAQPEPISLTDPKVVAAAIAAGGMLVRLEDTPEGRTAFFIDGLAPDFHLLLINDRLQVSAQRFIQAWGEVFRILEERKRKRRR